MKLLEFVQQNKQLAVKIGLAFSLLLISSIGFVAIADEIREGDTLGFDEFVLQSINQYSSKYLDVFFSTITHLGGVVFVAGTTAVLSAYLLYKRRFYKLALLMAGVGGAAVINQVLKALFERTRPDLWEQIVTETSFSFPSGHATASSALAFTIVALLWYSKWRNLSIALASIYVLVIGLSRLYLGVHFPTDIIGGWLMSVIWIMLVAGIVYARVRRSRRNKSGPTTSSDQMEA